MSDHEPRTTRGRKIRDQVSQDRWKRLVADALRRVEVLELVVAERKESSGPKLDFDVDACLLFGGQRAFPDRGNIYWSLGRGHGLHRQAS